MKPSVAVLCALSLLAQPLQAATFNVTNMSDSGAGSLRQAVLDSNGAGGANTISWGAGSGGITTLLSDTAGVAANTNLDLSGADSAVTVAGAPNGIPLAGAVTFTNSGSAAAVSAVLSGAGSLTKAGTGALNLTGANTYAGGTTLNAGTLGVGIDASLGNAAGALTFNGGTLRYTAGFSSARNAALNAGGGTIDTNGFSSTLSGVLSGIGALTKSGAGTLTLTGANTYQGGTTLNAGTLNANADGALGNAAGGVTFNGGSLQLGAAFSSARGLTVNSGGGTLDTNGFNSTFSGVIGGAGNLAKTGAGTLTLTGVNTYSGGTTINAGTLAVGADAALGNAGGITFGGGTLQATGAFATTRAVNLSGNGTIDNNGNNLTFSGVISGGGALTYAGAGVTTVTGSNGYSGGTTLNAGTVNVNNNAALGSGAVTFNGGTLQTALNTGVTLFNTMAFTAGAIVDTNGGNSTFAGNIGGAGGLTKNGAGTLSLTGSNSFAGGINVNAGTLKAMPQSLGAGNIGINGGTFQAGGGLTITAKTITLGAGGGTIDSNQYTVIAGNIGGAGALTKAGAGTLLIGVGNNTYGGATTVNAGTLAIGLNSALPAATAVTVANGANLDLRSYTQTVASYAGTGAGLQLELANGRTNLTTTGNANLTNGVLTVTLQPQVIKTGDVFTPIAYGSRTGTLAAIASPALVSFTPTYNAGNMTLTATLVPFSQTPITSNQAAVGGSLEALRANPTGDVATVLSNLYTLDAQHLQTALDRMGPGSLAAIGGVGVSASNAHSSVVDSRVAALSEKMADAPRYTVTGPPYPGTLYAAAPGDVSAADAKNASPDTPWGGFVSAAFDSGRLNERDTAGGSQPGYAFNAQGLTAGADYRLNDNAVVGGALGWLHGHGSTYAPGSGTVDSQSFRLGGYGALFGGHFQGDLYLGLGVDSFNTRRDVVFGSLARTATGSPSGTELSIHPSLRYDLETRDWGTWSPFYQLKYDRLAIGGFTESGAGALDLDVGPQTDESLQQTMGLRFSQKLDFDTLDWTPFASLGWRHEFAEQSRPITASFAEAGGAPFQVMSGDVARDGAVIGAGSSLRWPGSTIVRLEYSGDFRSHFQDSAVELSFRRRF